MLLFWEKYEKYAARFFLGLMILCLIPMVLVGFYNHPTGDDYHYGYAAVMAWKESGSIIEMLKAVVAGTVEQFHVWQGTYSAMFLMHLPPQIFGDIFYKIYPGLLLTCFVISIFYLLHALICTLLKAGRNVWITTASLVVLLCTQQVPLCGETFYWYNGSMYYTGFLACTFLFWGALIGMLMKPTMKRLVGLAMLAIFIAGGNYVSLLPTLIILTILTCYYGYVYVRKKNSVRSQFFMLLVIFFCMMIGFMISVLAPGNALRQATSWKISPISAIAKSIYHSARYCVYWNGIWSVLFVIFITPIFVSVIGKCTWKFRYPLVVCGLIFGIYCSASCPTFYAQNNGGAARVFCMVYYLMILMQVMIYFYGLGAICRFLETHKKCQKMKKEFLPVGWMTGMGVLLVCSLILSICRPWKEAYVKPHAVTAVQVLTNGEAAYYEEQYRKRMAILQDDSVQEVIFKPYDVPESLYYFLYLGDLSQDKNADENRKIADIYNKRSVKVASLLP